MRKKIFPIFLLAAAACFAVSCEKDDTLSENPTNPNNQRLSKFSGSIEQLASDSKTHLGEGDVILWDSDDQIVINGRSYTASPSETDATKAQFLTSEEPDVDPDGEGYYTAYYPASIYNDGHPTLPAVQRYKADRIDNLPMYAKSSTNSLRFHNICGVMELNLTGSKSVMAISVTAMDNTALNGPFTVDNNKAVISSCSQASQRTVTLDCGTGVQLYPDNATKFWIALPAFQNKQLLLTVRATDGTCLLKKTVANVTMEANHIQEIHMNLATATFTKMSGYFQGTYNRILQFACGNLKKENGNYSFFLNQEGFENSDELSARQNVDLFSYNDLSTLTFHLTLDAYPTISDDPWEVLSDADWGSVIGTTRPGSTVNGTPGRHFAKVRIDGVNYALLCPDNAVIRDAHEITNWDNNTFTELTSDQWQVYEKAGCVLLPAAGRIKNSSVNDVGTYGGYWTSTYMGSTVAYYFYFYNSYFKVNSGSKDLGFSVRLAQAF